MTSKKRFHRLKSVNPQTDNNEVLKQKVSDDAGDLFNELPYIYMDKLGEEKKGWKARDKKSSNCKKKLRLTDDYQYESEKEELQTGKIEPSKKPD